MTMNRLPVIISMTLSLSLAGAGHAVETGTMQCTGGIVSIGDTAGSVAAKCGEPAFIAQRQQSSVERRLRSGYGATVTTVAIDDWTYNFGPNRFQYQVTLENGRVTRIESLDYGY
jgi:hypothetical protein